MSTEKALKKLSKDLKSLSSEEQKKLREVLQSKSKDEGDKLEWMYKESKPESEEYLLGRRVDRHINDSEQRTNATKDVPGALFDIDDDLISKRADLDMHTKMREDPLFAIRKKEEDAKKRLLENPIKMKQLQKMIKTKKEENKRLKKQKKKTHKKRGSDSSSDDDLIKQYLNILSKKKTKLTESKVAGSKDSKHGKNSRTRGSSSETEVEKRKERSYGLLYHPGKSESTHKKLKSSSPRQRSRSPEKRSKSPRQRWRSPQQKSRQRSTSPQQRSRSPRQKSSHQVSPQNRSRSPRRRSRSPVEKSKSTQQRSKFPDQKSVSPKRRKLTAEEMEEKRREMMENASWRQTQRIGNVQRHQEEMRKEEERHRNQGSSSNFINPLMASHASSSSLEDRIKRNKYNIQRTKADLDKNFAKKH